jgi:hypothetical protein
MAFECPFCRTAVDPRAEICPHGTSDISYQRPHSPVEMLQGVRGTVKGLGWELCFKSIFLIPFALLMGIPFLPLIVIVGGIYLFFKLVMASISSTIDSAKSQKDSEQRSDKDPQGNGHE